MAGGGGWGLSPIYINPKKKIKKKNKKKIKKKKIIYIFGYVSFFTYLCNTEDTTESSPLPAAIGSNESLVLDRVGRI